MKDGFIKVAAVTPEVKVADVKYNVEEIKKNMKIASQDGAKVVVFPELSITAYTCSDLFFQDTLLNAAIDGLKDIADYSKDLDALFFVGLPLTVKGKIYNVAAAVNRGKVLGFVPKTHIPNYNEFYEARQFASGKGLNTEYDFEGYSVPVSTDIIFVSKEVNSLRIAAEMCEDLWVPNPPSITHALSGANVIVNLSASNELTAKSEYRENLVRGQSSRLVCAYIYASACDGESTQDLVYSGQRIIAENNVILENSGTFTSGISYAEIDIQKLENERHKMSSFDQTQFASDYSYLTFNLEVGLTDLTRYIDPAPFVPASESDRDKRCNEIFMIQATGLKKRLQHISCKKAVLGISGGLDSTLALLVTSKAFDLLGLDKKGIIAVTMPGFGTTDRTYDNAVNLIKCIGAEFREISIVESVKQHFTDIGQDINNHDVTYENSQARERTQILMDIANMENGIVVGTGDLSELALGWATYNGDHISMYGVNGSVPKTLVRYIVKYCADTCGDKLLRDTLNDVLDTPVSPELLPPENGAISQKTEDLVGPYELHDFFIYHMVRYNESPSKIYRLALIAFKDKYDNEYILKWLKVFYRRFFSQQFKRSCIPDGPKVGSVALSPRGDLRMPTDACSALWLDEIEKI